MQDSTSYAGYETTLRNEAAKAQAKVKGGAKKAASEVCGFEDQRVPVLLFRTMCLKLHQT